MIFNSAPPDKEKPPQGETLYLRAWRWLYDRVGVYIEDFRFVPEENTVEAEEPLSAKRCFIVFIRWVV